MTNFYLGRLMRIMPALLVVLAATLALYILVIPEAWLSRSIARTGIAAYFGVSNVALGLSGDNYFSPLATLNPFTHTWSLGVQEQFYLVFPFIMYWRQSSAEFERRNSLSSG